MNILLTGAAGQLGSELHPLLSRRGNVTATDRVTAPGSGVGGLELDITDADKLEVMLNHAKPALIVNTAAYTAVDQAETDRQTAFEVNATLPGRLAGWAKRNDARVLHYSTDYVFDGKASKPYCESDVPSPQNVYGESKLAGEIALQSSQCKYAILRTSWVYSSHGNNFVLSMLDLARRGLSLNIVDDQRGCPTWARNLAIASDAVIESWQTPGSARNEGVFHYCDDETLSWYDFARAIFALAATAGLLGKEPELTPVPSSGFPQPARRPQWSVLNTQKIAAEFSIHPAPFRQSLEKVIDEIVAREPSA